MKPVPVMKRPNLFDRPAGFWPVFAVLLVLACLRPPSATAQQTDCGNMQALDHAFASGAMWSMCLSIEASHGLSIHSASYRAPGDTLRQVLSEAHMGQVLLHYHDSATATAQINPALQTQLSAAGSDLLSMNGNLCQGSRLEVSGVPEAVCSRIRDNRILAKYAQRPSIQSQSLELSSAFQRETLTWTTRYNFTEDGQIRPSLSLSGRAARTSSDARYSQTVPSVAEPVTRATVLATWRLVFDLDTPATDRIQQFDFPLDTDDNNRRPMQVTELDTETLLQVNRENFRGWRVIDASGAGYYLDPANSGFHYRSADMNWAQFDAAVTAYRPCERHALLNTGALRAGEDPPSPGACGSSLDAFVDGENLAAAQPVLWYSLSRTLDPRIEDWPVLRDITLTFDLLPFDWTAASPFEVNPE